MMKEIKFKKLIALLLILSVIGIVYIFNPYKLEHIGHRDKIMAHRVNSLEKLSYTENFYSGVELDLMYDAGKQTFDINHPPTPSIGLDLKTYVTHIQNKNLKLWLDMKNLSEENAAEAAKILHRIITENGIAKKNVLVESPKIQLLHYFKAEGFATSFYLPYFMYEEDEVTLKKTIDSLNTLKLKYAYDGISADVNNYEILKQHFPDDRKFLWDLHQPYSRRQVKHFKEFRKYVKDPTVEIILVRVALPIGSR